MIGTLGAHLVVLAVAGLGVLLGVAATALSRPRGGEAETTPSAPPAVAADASHDHPRVRLVLLLIGALLPLVLAWAAASTRPEVSVTGPVTVAVAFLVIAAAAVRIVRRHS